MVLLHPCCGNKTVTPLGEGGLAQPRCRPGQAEMVALGHVLPARHVVEHAVKGAPALGRRRGRVPAIKRVAADIVTDPAVLIWRNRP